MKKSHLMSGVLLGLISLTGFSAKAETNKSILPDHPIMIQGGPGIAISMSSSHAELPLNAQKFLRTVYSRDAVGPVTFNAVKERYSVEVGNGTQIVFDKNGRVVDIQAPRGESLYGRAVAAVLPEKAYKHLEDAGLLEYVTGIKNADSRGLRVMLLNAMPPEMLFDFDGLFVIIDD